MSLHRRLAVNDREQFIAQAEKLVRGLLREALGFTIESEIPFYRGIAGCMVEAPLLWIRHSRFPILFVGYDGKRPDTLSDVVKQLEMAKATEFFALLVVVPTAQGTGNEAEELRLLVNDSVYRHDFVVLDRQHLASIIAQNNAQRLIEIILEQGIELSALSPYVVHGPVPSNMFFGREREIKEISQALPHGNYALVGGRRIGKSSILQSLYRLLRRDPRFSAHYQNLEGVFDSEGFFTMLEIQFSGHAREHTPQAFRRLVSDLKAEAGAKRPIFLMDEVDALLDFDGSARVPGQLFGTFRALAHERTCSFVFSGSKVLHRHFHDPGSPFFNFCHDLPLGPLSERSVVEIVSKPMLQLGIQLVRAEELIGRIVDVTSCHPSLVQWLCDQLLRGAEHRIIRPDDVTRVAASAPFRRYFCETAWGDATPLERLVSVLMEEPDFSLDDLVVAAARHGMRDRSAISHALRMLELCALIDRHEGRYRYVLSQFPRIVRETEDVPSLVEGWLSQVEV
jgi:hypothetical protein